MLPSSPAADNQGKAAPSASHDSLAVKSLEGLTGLPGAERAPRDRAWA